MLNRKRLTVVKIAFTLALVALTIRLIYLAHFWYPYYQSKRDPYYPLERGLPVVIEYRIHIVEEGESLWTISKRYGVSFKETVNANPGLRDPNLIHPGDVVLVPDYIRSPYPNENLIRAFISPFAFARWICWETSVPARYKVIDRICEKVPYHSPDS